MKVKSLFIALIAATMSLQSFAIVETNVIKDDIQAQVTEILSGIEWEAESGTTIEARVCFNVTTDGKVRLVKVKAENHQINRLVKEELHEAQLNGISLEEDSEYYWMSVKFEAE